MARRTLWPGGARIALVAALLGFAALWELVSPSSPHASAGAAARVTLLPEAAVTGDSVYLGDIAEIEAASDALKARLEALYVGRAALPGATRQVSAGEITLRIRQARLPESEIEVAAPAGPTRVTTVGAALGKEEFRDALRTWYGKSGAVPEGARLVLDVAVSPVSAPAGAVEIRPAMAGPAWGKFTATFDIYREGELVRRVHGTVTAGVVQEVPVAIRPLARGEIVGPADVEYVEMELQEPLDGWVVTGGFRAARHIPAGTVLTSRWVERVPDVERGASVPVAARVGSVVVVVAGVAAQDGFAGEGMEVVNPDSGKRLYGTLSPDGVVWVQGL